MLSSVGFELFKCFELLTLPLRPLTLLSGSNASGKSSVLQGLGLLNQTMRHDEWALRLALNGAYLQLGALSDVVDKINGRQQFHLAVSDERNSCEWSFEGDRRGLSAGVTAVSVNSTLHQPPDRLRFLLPPGSPVQELVRVLRTLTYLTAERVGPRELYQRVEPGNDQVVGAQGENAVGILDAEREGNVSRALTIASAPPLLLRQTERRMQQFFPGCSLEVQRVARANAVTLGVRTSSATDFHRPMHVGFGFSQVLPIIVAALRAKKGDLLLLENPEVHLHPAAQARMGHFLAEVASAGVQVLLETHSDHILNGLRRAVRSGALASEDVQLHYFRERSADAAQVVSPGVDSRGNIDDWPSGFFDQFDKDAVHFAGWE